MKIHIGNLKVGDRVRRNRRCFKGIETIGTIIEVTTPQIYFPYVVRWDDGIDGIALGYGIDELEKIVNHPHTSIFK